MLQIFKNKDFSSKKYLINVMNEIVKNFTYSLLISEKINFKKFFLFIEKIKKY